MHAALLGYCDYDDGAAVPGVHLDSIGCGAKAFESGGTAAGTGQREGCQVSLESDARR